MITTHSLLHLHLFYYRRVQNQLSSFYHHPALYYIDESPQVVASGCAHSSPSSWTTSLPGREFVSSVSGLAWCSSGHAGVRWAIDPSQQAFPPGDSSAHTTPPPHHWLSAMTLRCHGRTWHLMILWWSNVTFITCWQMWRGRICGVRIGQGKKQTI